MEDGEFIARIAEESDAYILLDLHNLLTNQQNGRQPVKELLQQLPAERVIELRINSPELLPLADAIVPALPCLKSLYMTCCRNILCRSSQSTIYANSW